MLDTTQINKERKALNQENMVLIDAGSFMMGSDKFYPEEKPVHKVTVDGFWMDRYPVTNKAFSDFVSATNYMTVPAGSIRRDLAAPLLDWVIIL
jgi:sulfatase modifying factor 1